MTLWVFILGCVEKRRVKHSLKIDNNQLFLFLDTAMESNSFICPFVYCWFLSAPSPHPSHISPSQYTTTKTCGVSSVQWYVLDSHGSQVQALERDDESCQRSCQYQSCPRAWLVPHSRPSPHGHLGQSIRAASAASPSVTRRRLFY